tara:strand:+ start:1980 stop:2318 length:339 start_codon:yes stop_codon:yes gene_type:complete
MPTTDLTFPNNINVSVQIGDIIYYTPTTLNGIHNTAGTIIELGFVTAINGNTITVDYIAALPQPGDFIMFAKDRSVNMSSLLGYFAKFRIRNNSQDKAEMYSIAVDVIESSK